MSDDLRHLFAEAENRYTFKCVYCKVLRTVDTYNQYCIERKKAKERGEEATY